MYRELILDSTMAGMSAVEKFVEEICDTYYIFNSYYGNILLAVEEAFNNAVIHGNKKDKDKKVILSFRSVDNGLVFTIEDEGKGFNYHSVPNPLDVEESLLGSTGKGIFLISSVADKVEYNERGNRVSITFNISSLNQETTVNRIASLQQYFQKQKTTA
jgi:serine/threonine-protein kinase RsbW